MQYLTAVCPEVEICSKKRYELIYVDC